MLNAAGVSFFDLMTINTVDPGRGHGADDILLDDTRCGPAMANNAFIIAVGQRINALLLAFRLGCVSYRCYHKIEAKVSNSAKVNPVLCFPINFNPSPDLQH
jgi:hypothetical protein